jgi:hypothetical protein
VCAPAHYIRQVPPEFIHAHPGSRQQHRSGRIRSGEQGHHHRGHPEYAVRVSLHGCLQPGSNFRSEAHPTIRTRSGRLRHRLDRSPGTAGSLGLGGEQPTRSRTLIIQHRTHHQRAGHLRATQPASMNTSPVQHRMSGSIKTLQHPYPAHHHRQPKPPDYRRWHDSAANVTATPRGRRVLTVPAASNARHGNNQLLANMKMGL